MTLALFITTYYWTIYCRPISRNALSESRNLNPFLAASTSSDRDRRWTARTVSTLVAVARVRARPLFREFPFALALPLAQSVPRMLAGIRQTQLQAQRGSHRRR